MTRTEHARVAYAAAQVESILKTLQRETGKGAPGNLRARAIAAMQHSTAITIRDLLLGAVSFDPKKRVSVKLNVMTDRHPRWKKFRDRLQGAEGIDARKNGSEWSWKCAHNHAHSTKILRAMGCDVPTSIAFFVQHGGYCDCEVLFNVTTDRPQRGRPRIRKAA